MNYEERQSQSTNSKGELIKAWSKLYNTNLSKTEYLEICDNLKGFFETLREWDKNKHN